MKSKQQKRVEAVERAKHYTFYDSRAYRRLGPNQTEDTYFTKSAQWDGLRKAHIKYMEDKFGC